MFVFDFWNIAPFTGKLNPRKYQELKAQQEYLNIFTFLCSSALDAFEWNGLPDTCDPRMLEMSLISRGEVAIVNDPNYGFLSLPCGNASKLTLYGYPEAINAYGFNGFNKNYKVWIPYASKEGDDYQGVICYDNDCRYPYSFFIAETAQRIADLMMACDTCAENLKRSSVIAVTNDAEKKTIDEFLAARSANMASILISDKFGALKDRIMALPLNNSPECLKALTEYLEWTENYFTEKLGINSNPQTNKKERLLVDEQNANNEITEINMSKRLKCREVFCEQLNQAFNLNVSVKAKHEIGGVENVRDTDDISGDGRQNNTGRDI